VGYLTPLLLWDDPADAGTTTTIDDIRFTVSGTGGTTVANRFNNTEVAADWLQQLPVGEYDLLVTADMDEAHGYVLENVGADTRSTTRADEEFHTALPDIRVSLSQPSSSPHQSWYAVTHATVREDEITVAEFRLQRLLSELSVIVSNVPTGATITASVERVARDVLLTHRDGQGRYGVADREDYMTVSLGALTATGSVPAAATGSVPAAATGSVPDAATGSVPDGTAVGTLRHDDHTLMPTAGGQPRCYLTLTVTTPEGTRLSYLADAPRMECGRAYVVELDYTKLRPYMLLSAFTINDWTEGWTVSGEIINPDRQ
jgi:hypothetical protein